MQSILFTADLYGHLFKETSVSDEQAGDADSWAKSGGKVVPMATGTEG